MAILSWVSQRAMNCWPIFCSNCKNKISLKRFPFYLNFSASSLKIRFQMGQLWYSKVGKSKSAEALPYQLYSLYLYINIIV